MKLHLIHNSNNCRRVNATVLELGLDVEIVHVDMAKGATREPAFLAINPNGKVPVLEDGDLKLWESNAIMQYLASTKANTLWPDDARKRADIARWQFWECNHLSTGTGPAAFEKLFKPMFLKQEPDLAVFDRAVKAFNVHAPVLNAQLETRKYVTGDTLTLADFSVGASFSFSEMAGLPLSDYKHLQAWLGRLGELPSWQKSAPKLG